MEKKQYTLENGIILDIRNLSISFGGLKAVDDLSFNIKENEIFGLIGPNGAGKTTVFNCITQFYNADEGEIIFKDKDNNIINLNDIKVHNVIKKGLVRTFQNVELIRELSILENVLIGAHVYFKTGILGHMFNSNLSKKEEKIMREKAVKILKYLEIERLKDMPAGGQPYGIMKKVELARTLMSEPKLIILDEPAAGLNDAETVEFAQTIRNIRDELSCSILLVEHDMRLIMDVCERICAISFGKFLGIGTAEEIQKNPLVQSAYLGTEA